MIKLPKFLLTIIGNIYNYYKYITILFLLPTGIPNRSEEVPVFQFLQTELRSVSRNNKTLSQKDVRFNEMCF